MLVRFIDNNLVGETGEVLQISFEQLKEACLSSNIKSLSIFDIISDGVKNCTGGYIVIKGNHQKSILYNQLQEAIYHDERYKLQIEEKNKKRIQLKEAEQQEKQKNLGFLPDNPHIAHRRKKRMRDFYSGDKLY